MTPADLKAGDVDVAFIAAYVDMGAGQRGANRGPNALRHSRAEYVTWGEFSMPHMETMINPLKDIVAVDYGDAPNDHLSTERTMERGIGAGRLCAEHVHASSRGSDGCAW